MSVSVFLDSSVQTEQKLPFHSILSPGMPIPGQDFVEEAIRLGEAEAVIGKNEDGKYLVSAGPVLEKLYYDATHQENFTIKALSKGRLATATFIRGHYWGYEVTGPRRASVMVVGKWPGNEEVRAGRNLIGPSGQILMTAVERSGLAKSEYDRWYITNVIKHPNLDPSSQKVPNRWIVNGRIILEEELRIVQPDYILALGKEASKELIGSDFKFDLAAGRTFIKRILISEPDEEPRYKEAKVIACLHPAFIARQSDRLPEFQATINRFVLMSCGGQIKDVEDKPDHRLIFTERELNRLVDEILAAESATEQPIIAIDCEWHGEYPTEDGSYLRTLQFSHKPGFGACVVLRRQGGQEAFVPSIEHAVRPLKRLLLNNPKTGRKVRIGGHHLRADLPWVVNLDKELGEGLIRQYAAPATPELTRTEGGFDTMLAAHAVTEAPGKLGFKLEVLASSICGTKRYDAPLQKWKSDYCKDLKLTDDELEGYGECPNEILEGKQLTQENESSVCGVPVKDSYSVYDVDVTRRLVEAYNKPGGLLDKDQYGNNSREAFWESMAASPAILEMEMRGLLIDRKRGEELTEIYFTAKQELIVELRKLANWKNFNPNSHPQCCTLLFGSQAARVIDKRNGDIKDISPVGSLKLNLTPIKTSGKPSKPWHKILRRNEAHLYSPSSDKEVLGILRMQLKEDAKLHPDDQTLVTAHAIVEKLRHIRFAGQVIKSVLRPPVIDKKTQSAEVTEDGDQVFEKGLLSSIHNDGRVRTHIFQTKETGRCSSARPPLQNLSGRREADYKEILGKNYKYALRSMIKASPGYVLVESDYTGAELFIMAIQSGDKAMIDHCQRSALKESDPNFYDIHSNIAVSAFKLVVLDYVPDEKDGRTASQILGLPVGAPLPPTKTGLWAIGQSQLRIAAKTIAFGIPYGRGNEAVIRAVEEEGVKITVSEADDIRAAIFQKYPNLEPYLESCKDRVYEPGWMANCCKRYRRFQNTGLDDAGEMARQASNYPIQAGVASAVSRALWNSYNRSDRFDEHGQLKYWHVLQIHDAILFEVAIPYIDWFCNDEDGVIKQAMTDSVEIYQCDLAGNRIPNGPAYHMGVETKVMSHWGTKYTIEQGRELGIPEKYCVKPKK